MHVSPSSVESQELIAKIRRQNFYQRLGLVTNAVTGEAISAGYAVRMRLLRDSVPTSAEDLLKIEQLLSEARQTLEDAQKRRRYDRALWRAHLQTQSQTQPSNAKHIQAAAYPMADSGAAGATQRLLSPIAALQPTIAPVAASPATSVVTGNAVTASAPQIADGRYQQQHVLAEGARSIIYSGVDTRLNRRVIIKKIRDELAEAASHQQLFREEAELFASCNAGNLVKILDYDADSGTIVLERLKADLSSMVTEQGCDYRLVREFLRDALNGLASLHSHGVAHGRVELSHLLMDDSGGVKLAVTPGMTGLATALRPGREAMHVAPELLNASTFGQPGKAVDIYALGFVALELLCGRKFAQKVSPAIESTGTLANGWLLWHSSPTDHLPPITSLIPELPSDMADFLARMTNKQQHERFADAFEAREILRDQISSPSLVASGVSEDADTMTGVDLIGEPPPLHPAYDYVQRLQWRDIWNNPRWLLEPQGRNHAYILAIACMVSLSLLMMWLQSNSVIKTSAIETNETRLAEHLEEEVYADEDSSTNFESLESENPNESFDAVSGSESTQTSLLVESAATEPAAASLIAESSALAQSLAPSQEDVGEKSNPLQPDDGATEDRYADVRMMHYHPSSIAFDYMGAEDRSLAQLQCRLIQQSLHALVQRTKLPPKGKMPYRLPERPVDPRASFVLALIAYHQGDLTQARHHCQRSIHDAQVWKCPFVLPLRLLTQIQVSQGDFSSALAQCRSSLQWINSQAELGGDPRFREAGLHVAWWSGSIITFVEQTRKMHTHSQVDLEGQQSNLKELCTDEQWIKFRIGRSDVLHRYDQLSKDRREAMLTAAATANATATAEQPSYHVDTIQREFTLPLSTISYANSFQKADAQSMEENSPVDVRSKANRALLTLPSPQSFTSYRPCDITTLADATLISLRTAKLN